MNRPLESFEPEERTAFSERIVFVGTFLFYLCLYVVVLDDMMKHDCRQIMYLLFAIGTLVSFIGIFLGIRPGQDRRWINIAKVVIGIAAIPLLFMLVHIAFQ